MNITLFASNGNVFVNCECFKGHAFKNALTRVNSALLPVICAGFRNLRDNCAHFRRVECLLPHNSFA